MSGEFLSVLVEYFVKGAYADSSDRVVCRRRTVRDHAIVNPLVQIFRGALSRVQTTVKLQV